MIKLLRNKITQKFRVAEFKNGQWIKSDYMEFHQANELHKRLKRNAHKRETNQVLRDLTGTSARSARADMGL